jgi:hypothetical protein
MVTEARQRSRVLYGALLILSLAGVALVIFFLDDIIGSFERNYTLVALVPDAPGIARGTPVWVGGRLAGEVERVAILPTSLDTAGRVAVMLRLPVRVQPQVRADSRVRLTSVNLMSEAVIDILPGSTSAPAMAEGDTLRLESRPSARQISARAAGVRAELDTVMAALRSLAPAAQARLEETERALAGMDAVMVEVQRLRTDLAANEGAAALRDPAFQASLARAQSHAAALPRMIGELRERTAAGDIRAALARLQLRADTLAAQLDFAVMLLDEQHGFIGRVQQDSALARALHAARASLDSLVVEVRGNPLRFVF